MPLLFALLLCLPLAAQCLPADTSLPAKNNSRENLINELLSIMQSRYYDRANTNWQSVRRLLTQAVEEADGNSQPYQLINHCLRQMGARHSFLMAPAQQEAYAAMPDANPQSLQSLQGLRGFITATGIAYLHVPGFHSSNETLGTRFADSLQEIIGRLDRQGGRQWIIDLRDNDGGNCWPMIAGVGPLLQQDSLGFFVDGDKRIPIRYQQGTACQGKMPRCQLSRPGITLQNRQPAIALLIGPGTASAGEILALCFKGMDKVHFIGSPTAGLTTANGTYELSDHSLLVLSVCVAADRTGRICYGRITPDEEIITETHTRPDDDPAMQAAIRWLESF
jgi:hypothetical protein